MPQYSSSLTGIHPLSEPLIKRIFDYKYGRASSTDDVKTAFKKDIEDFIVLLLQSFPLAVSTGSLGWWDLLRPFSEEIQGLSHKGNTSQLPVARIPLTNTFYRQPMVKGKLSSSGSILKEARHPFLEGNILQTRFLPDNLRNTGWSLCLPGPYTFSRAATLNQEGAEVYRTRNDLMIDFSLVLQNELQYLSSEGFSHIVIDESSIALEPIDGDTASLTSDLWDQIATESSLKTIIHTFRNLNDEKLQLLLESKAWAVGVDCIRNDPNKLTEYDFTSKTLLAGVVDAQSYLRDTDGRIIVEKIDDLVKLGNKLAKTHAKDIILAPTSRLEFVPRSVADLKIKKLGKALEKLQEK